MIFGNVVLLVLAVFIGFLCVLTYKKARLRDGDDWDWMSLIIAFGEICTLPEDQRWIGLKFYQMKGIAVRRDKHGNIIAFEELEDGDQDS